jgi:hypothetical protein
MTFKELAEFILTQPDEIQESEATFTNLDDDEKCTINCENVKVITVIEKDFAPAIFGAPVAYHAIATSDDEIDDKYDYHSW